MTNIHEDLRHAECTRSWREMLESSKAKLRKGWDPTAWACEVSCLDALGETRDLFHSLETWQEAVRLSDIEVRSFNFYIAGRMHQTLGEYDLALAAYMRASRMGVSPETRALPQLQMSTIDFFVGNHQDALSNLEMVREEALSRNDAISAGHALDFLTDLAFRMKDLGLAQAYSRAAREQAERARNLYRLDWIGFLEGQIQCELGEIDAGIDRMKSAQFGFASTGARSSELHGCGRLANRLLNDGRVDEARDFIRRGLELSAFFRFNLSCAAILEVDAKLKHSTGELGRPEFERATKRAAILRDRATKCLSVTHGRTRVYSESDIAEFLATLDPELFEIVCLRILEYEGFRCTRTPESYEELDIVAEEPIGTRQTYRWGVTCKRVFRGVRRADVPDTTTLRENASGGLIIMTTGKISRAAHPRIETLRKEGHSIDPWDGSAVRKYLAEHDWILAEVGYRTSGFSVSVRPSKKRRSPARPDPA